YCPRYDDNRHLHSYPPRRSSDLADWKGVRGNQLVGYGLVVGLEGTGDGQSSQFTIQATVNMLRRFRINVSADQVKFKNIAAVMRSEEHTSELQSRGQLVCAHLRA